MRLLTFLGTGGYAEVAYRLDGAEYRTNLCPVALLHLLHDIDEVVAFVTPEAEQKWYGELCARASECGAKCRSVHIELPRDEKGLWNLFRSLEREMHDKPVALDITHAFRAIPLVGALVAGFAKAARPEHELRVFYGAYAAEADRDSAPVLDLSGLVAVLEWTSAVTMFERSGDAREMVDLLRQTGGPLGRGGKHEERQRIDAVAKALDGISNSLKACRPLDVPEDAAAAIERVADASGTLADHVPAFHAVEDLLREALEPLSGPQEGEGPRAMLRRQIEMVRWYAERDHVPHAFALAREWLVTLSCVRLGLDWRERDQRGIAEDALGRPARRDQHTEAGQELPQSIVKCFDKVGDWRNDLLHCGMRKGNMQATTLLRLARKLPQELEPLLAECDDIK